MSVLLSISGWNLFEFAYALRYSFSTKFQVKWSKMIDFIRSGQKNKSADKYCTTAAAFFATHGH